MLAYGMSKRSTTSLRQFALIVVVVTIGMFAVRSVAPDIAYIIAPIVFISLAVFLIWSWVRDRCSAKRDADNLDC